MAWFMRVVLFAAVALGFATAAFQSRKLNRKHAVQSANIRALLITTWSCVIILAIITILEMVVEPSVPRVVCAVVEALVWTLTIVYMLRTTK
jgi:hypothetical protein